MNERRTPSLEEVGPPQAERLHQHQRLDVGELSRVRERGELGEAELDRGDVLVLVDAAATLAGAAAIGRKIEMHALGGDALIHGGSASILTYGCDRCGIIRRCREYCTLGGSDGGTMA